MPASSTTNVLTVGEKMVALARLLAAEHVGQEVAALRPAAVFAGVPIAAPEARAVRVSVRRIEPVQREVYEVEAEELTPRRREAA